MLKILRENASSWLIKGLLILVAVTFVSWGGSYLLREKKTSYAAMVNGTVIDLREYGDAYQTLIKQYRDALGPSFNDKMLADLKLKEKLLDDFINRILVVQHARSLGLSVSDGELQDMIHAVPGFQDNGQFDPRLYERFLRSQRTNAEEFERLQRERILMGRMVNLVRQNAGKISEQEVRDVFVFENERVNLNFIKVSPGSFKGQVTLNDIELKDYYTKNQEEFRAPTFVQIQYLAFRPSDYEGKAQISPEDIKRTYETQKDRFRIPKQVKAREILIKVDPQDPTDKVDEKRKKAEAILEKVKKTKDFGALARQASESETAPKGGDMGWIQKGMVDQFSEAALFSLKGGETSGLVVTPSGFSIFKVEEVKEEKERSFEEVKEEILKTMKRERGKGEASRRAEDAFYSLFRNRDIETYAREKNVTIRTTGFFKDGDDVPEIGKDPSFHASAFSLKVGEISSVLQTGPNFYILKLINKKESRIPPFEEVKQEVSQKAAVKKSEEKARQVAEDLLKKIRGGKEIREAAREVGLSVEETGFFTRTQGIIPKIGPVKDSGSVLAPLTDKNPLPKEVIQAKDGYFVARLLAVEPADQNRFAAIQKDLERRLNSQKQEEFFQGWIAQLKTKAKIDINQDVLK